MARQARKRSETGIYHIVLQGINRQALFADEEDRERLLSILKQYKAKGGYAVLGYCLLDNNIHLLLKEGAEPLATTMKRIGVSYAYWYNMKNRRSGHLFQDRYKSQPVEDDKYLLSVLRYMHQSPVKAGLAKDMAGYKWSSYNEYTGAARIVDPSFALGVLSGDERQAREAFGEYMAESDDTVITIEAAKRLTDEEACAKIRKIADISAVRLRQLDREARDELLRKIKGIEGLSIRQIARITGFSASIVARA